MKTKIIIVLALILVLVSTYIVMTRNCVKVRDPNESDVYALLIDMLDEHSISYDVETAVRIFQETLAQEGYLDINSVDGILGPETYTSYQRWYIDNRSR